MLSIVTSHNEQCRNNKQRRNNSLHRHVCVCCGKRARADLCASDSAILLTFFIVFFTINNTHMTTSPLSSSQETASQSASHASHASHAPLRLAGKTALVSGAARGIGRGIAELFAREGASVVVSDVLDEAGAALVADIVRRGGTALYQHLDVRSEDEWQQAIAAAESAFGGLHIVVNNAGITGFPEDFSQGFAPHNPEHVSLADWHAVHAVNLDGVMLGCKYGIAALKRSGQQSGRQSGRQSGGGSIVNISSRSGIVGIPAASSYASSKAAVRNHTKSVALYCAQQGYGIRCNSIHPAAILTPMWDAMLGTGAARTQALKSVEAGIPLGAMGTVDDVAYAALYLASDESRYVTGIELTIDGGILAGADAAPKPASE
jgi:3(or 17)beta-hydroxysteroid dehydrogenase